ncbi:MAG: DUF59 domain-containing protein, partial [Myxococcales bacterium]|nr:DUF59 domain-containing protein [Myxococcales bacterium]
MDAQKVKQLLAAVPSPAGDGDVVSAGLVREVLVEGGEVTVVLGLDGFDRATRHALEDRVLNHLKAQDGVDEVVVEVESADVPTPAAAPRPPPGVTMHGAGGGGAARP